MFHRLRNYGDATNNKDAIVDKTNGHRYPRKLGRFAISGIRDLTTGFDSRASDGKAVSICDECAISCIYVSTLLVGQRR